MQPHTDVLTSPSNLQLSLESYLSDLNLSSSMAVVHRAHKSKFNKILHRSWTQRDMYKE